MFLYYFLIAFYVGLAIFLIINLFVIRHAYIYRYLGRAAKPAIFIYLIILILILLFFHIYILKIDWTEIISSPDFSALKGFLINFED